MREYYLLIIDYMDTNQTDLFNYEKAPLYTGGTANATGSEKDKSVSPGRNKLTVSDIDQHMIGIISEYIKKLPDNDTKKYIARLMINFIMKSADL